MLRLREAAIVPLALLSGLARAEVPAPTGPSHLLFHERAAILERDQVTVSTASRLSREVLSFDRRNVAFPESGPTVRAGVGLGSSWEARADFGWITQSGSGHSGQFDLAAGAKRGLAEAGPLRAAALFSAGGTKNMGWIPWYWIRAKLPVSLRLASLEELELSAAPVLLRSLSGGGYFAAALESALEWRLSSRLALLLEGYYHPEELNRRFTSFHDAEGLAGWAGLSWSALPRVRLPVLVGVKPPRAGLMYGLVMTSVQLSL